MVVGLGHFQRLFALMRHLMLSAIMQLPVGMEVTLWYATISCVCISELLPPSSHCSVIEARRCLTPGLDHTRLADVLVRDWAQGKPAAFDITVTHVSPNQVSQQKQPHYWQRRGSTRLMTPSVIRTDVPASLLLWRAMGTGVLKPDRLFLIWPHACLLASDIRSQRSHSSCPT